MFDEKQKELARLIEIRDDLKRINCRVGAFAVLFAMAFYEKGVPASDGMVGEIQGSTAHSLLGYSGAVLGAVAAYGFCIKNEKIKNTVVAASAMALNFIAEQTQDRIGITSHNFTTDIPETAKDAAFAGLGLVVYMAVEKFNERKRSPTPKAN